MNLQQPEQIKKDIALLESWPNLWPHHKSGIESFIDNLLKAQNRVTQYEERKRAVNICKSTKKLLQVTAGNDVVIEQIQSDNN